MALNEPILVNEFSSLARMGPFMLIGSFLHGPIHAHQWFSSWETMGPLEFIGSCFMDWSGPTHAVTFGLHYIRRYIGLHCSFFLSPHTEAHVQYDLASLLCTI